MILSVDLICSMEYEIEGRDSRRNGELNKKKEGIKLFQFFFDKIKICVIMFVLRFCMAKYSHRRVRVQSIQNIKPLHFQNMYFILSYFVGSLEKRVSFNEVFNNLVFYSWQF